MTTKAVPSSGQEALGCGVRAPVALHRSTGSSLVVTGREGARVPGQDAGMRSHVKSSWQVRRLFLSSR